MSVAFLRFILYDYNIHFRDFLYSCDERTDPLLEKMQSEDVVENLIANITKVGCICSFVYVRTRK